MSIIEELVSQTIRAGGDAVEVEHKDGYEEVFPVKGWFGTSVGFRLDSSSQEAKSLREGLYGIAKKRRRLTVDGREYELRCQVYDHFGAHAFRLEWKVVKPCFKGSTSEAPLVTFRPQLQFWSTVQEQSSWRHQETASI